MEQLSVTTRQAGSRTVISVAGELDIASGPLLQDQILEQLEAGHTAIVVDLTELEFMDSTGLGILVAALKRMKLRGGTLRLVCRHERILRVIRITGLAHAFPIYATIDDALSTERDAEPRVR